MDKCETCGHDKHEGMCAGTKADGSPCDCGKPATETPAETPAA